MECLRGSGEGAIASHRSAYCCLLDFYKGMKVFVVAWVSCDYVMLARSLGQSNTQSLPIIQFHTFIYSIGV